MNTDGHTQFPVFNLTVNPFPGSNYKLSGSKFKSKKKLKARSTFGDKNVSEGCLLFFVSKNPRKYKETRSGSYREDSKTLKNTTVIKFFVKKQKDFVSQFITRLFFSVMSSFLSTNRNRKKKGGS